MTENNDRWWEGAVSSPGEASASDDPQPTRPGQGEVSGDTATKTSQTVAEQTVVEQTVAEPVLAEQAVAQETAPSPEPDAPSESAGHPGSTGYPVSGFTNPVVPQGGTVDVPQGGYGVPGGQYDSAGRHAGWTSPMEVGWGTPAANHTPPSGSYPTPSGSYPMVGAQPPGYGPPGQPMPGYGGPRKNRTGLIIGIVVVVVLLIGGGIAALVLTDRSSSSNNASSSSSERSTTVDPNSTTTPAVIPGYQGVAVPAFDVAYDVPTGWAIESAATTWLIGGFTGRGQADDGAHYCPGSGYRAVSTVTDSGLQDPATAATSVGSTAAQTSYGDSAATAVPAVPLTTLGGIVGQMVETDGNWTPNQPGCTTTSFSIYTFAFPGPKGSALVLTLLADRGTAGELSPDLANQIITSIRALGN
ncbi:hypothetical protein [Nocardia alni]|uniref:hypothetical protein n=1 Tax=Nocardia alni TaxID=2815723 RepID=UPI001C21D901|nr:hypothetical protein [Nocardia alni]